MESEEEIRLAALTLAVKMYKDRTYFSFSDIEAATDRFVKYLKTGVM